MLRNLLGSIAAILAVTVLGGWLYYRFFYTGSRRRPAYRSLHSYAPKRRPIVWIDWEEKHGDRILTFGAPL